MERRNFLRGLALLAACPLCVKTAFAAEGVHWSYEGEEGPEHWGSLGEENGACSAGSQQSPIDITGAMKADIPDLATDWKSGGTILNNGHTIQVKTAPGGTLKRGDKTYDLVQYHFHAPSEHLVEGRASRWRCISSISTPKPVISAKRWRSSLRLYRNASRRLIPTQAFNFTGGGRGLNLHRPARRPE